MSSFLIKNKSEKSFEEKISKLARKTQESIKASNKSFEKFCMDNYDERTSQDIFDENDPLYPTYQDMRNNFQRYTPEMLEDLVVKLVQGPH